MHSAKYLIIGGGMAADSAVQGIRKIDATGEIVLIGAESHAPYNRPPLSKGLWKGDAVESIWRTAAPQGAELRLGRKIVQLNPQEKKVTDDQGAAYSFEKLLIATGGTVNQLPFGGGDIIYFRTFDDYQRLRKLADSGNTFAVIGGGFIGWEIAAALAMSGRKVTMFFPQPALGTRMFPHALAMFLNELYRQKGVEVAAGETVASIERANGTLKLKTTGGRTAQVDGVVAGIGIRPNLELAQAAGLKTNNGLVVNQHLQTSHPDISGAGDVAEFFNPALKKRMRVEHEDAANSMGETAGSNMAGEPVAYDHLPFFY